MCACKRGCACRRVLRHVPLRGADPSGPEHEYDTNFPASRGPWTKKGPAMDSPGPSQGINCTRDISPEGPNKLKTNQLKIGPGSAETYLFWHFGSISYLIWPLRPYFLRFFIPWLGPGLRNDGVFATLDLVCGVEHLSESSRVPKGFDPKALRGPASCRTSTSLFQRISGKNI